jgi:drug/metabolite transporter (DMT)-like permease
MTTINRAMNAREWALLFALSVLWGASFFCTAIVVRELPPFTVVFLRVVLAALTLYAIVVVMRIRMPTEPRVWLALVLMSAVNNVIPFALLVWGQTRIPSGVASVLNATTPFFTLLLAHLATHDEKLTGARVLGVVLGIAGVAVMIGRSLAAFDSSFLGELAVIGSALSYAAGGVIARRFSMTGISPLASSTGLLTVSSVVMLPLMLAVDEPWTLPLPSVQAIAAILYLAIAGTALAYLIYFRLVATAGATNLMLVTFLMPTIAILLGVAVLGERLELRQVAGMALIALGLAAIDGRPWRWLRGRALAADGVNR